jgi:hypothetical protein
MTHEFPRRTPRIVPLHLAWQRAIEHDNESSTRMGVFDED